MTSSVARASAFLERLARIHPDAPGSDHLIAAVGYCGDRALARWTTLSASHPGLLDATEAVACSGPISEAAASARELVEIASTGKRPGIFARAAMRRAQQAILELPARLQPCRDAAKRLEDGARVVAQVASETLASLHDDVETLATLDRLLEADPRVDPEVRSQSRALCLERARDLGSFVALVLAARTAAETSSATALLLELACDAAMAAITVHLPTLEQDPTDLATAQALLSSLEIDQPEPEMLALTPAIEKAAGRAADIMHSPNEGDPA